MMGVEAVGATSSSAAQSSSTPQSLRFLTKILEAVHSRDEGANLILGVTSSTYQVVFVRDPDTQKEYAVKVFTRRS